MILLSLLLLIIERLMNWVYQDILLIFFHIQNLQEDSILVLKHMHEIYLLFGLVLGHVKFKVSRNKNVRKKIPKYFNI